MVLGFLLQSGTLASVVDDPDSVGDDTGSEEDDDAVDDEDGEVSVVVDCCISAGFSDALETVLDEASGPSLGTVTGLAVVVEVAVELLMDVVKLGDCVLLVDPWPPCP